MEPETNDVKPAEGDEQPKVDETRKDESEPVVDEQPKAHEAEAQKAEEVAAKVSEFEDRLRERQGDEEPAKPATPLAEEPPSGDAEVVDEKPGFDVAEARSIIEVNSEEISKRLDQIDAIQAEINELRDQSDFLAGKIRDLEPKMTQAEAHRQIVESAKRQREARAAAARNFQTMTGGQVPTVGTPAENARRGRPTL